MKKEVTFLLGVFFSILAFSDTLGVGFQTSLETVDPPVVSVSVVSPPAFGNVVVEQNLNNNIQLYTNGACNAVSNAVCQDSAQQGIILLTASPNNPQPVNLIRIRVDQNSWSLANGNLTLRVGPEAANTGAHALTVNFLSFSLNPPLGTCGVTLAPGAQCQIFIGGQLTNITEVEGYYETTPVLFTVEYNAPF